MADAHFPEAPSSAPEWNDAVLNEEGLFRISGMALLVDVRRCWENNDLEQARKLIRSFAWVSSQCISGWRASAFDLTACQLAMDAAYLLYPQRRFETIMHLVGVVLQLMQTGVERRKALGEHPRSFTQVRLGIINLMADVKWVASAELLNYLYTPEEMMDQLYAFDQRIREYTRVVYRDAPAEAEHYYEELRWAAISLAKMCLRHYPEGLQRITEYFSGNYGLALVEAENVYRQGPPDTRFAVFFWDFEVAKQWSAFRNKSASANCDELLEAIDYCHKQRDIALENATGIDDHSKLHLRDGWLREWRLLRRDLLPQLEVV